MATMPAATAAAAPPDDPPGVREGSSGLRAIGPMTGSLASDRPNSGLVVRPKGQKPAWRKRLARSESALEGSRAKRREPAVTGRPAKGPPRSLARVGTPAK